MTISGRIARLEARRTRARSVYFATSEDAALRAGVPVEDCIITGNAEDYPLQLVYTAASLEDALAELAAEAETTS